MIAARFDIPCPRGGTLDIAVIGTYTNGTPINFATDYDSCRLEVRHTWDKLPGKQNVKPLLELDTANGGLIVSGTTLQIFDNANKTLLYKFSNAEYELELIKNGTPEIVDKFLYGKFKVGTDI